MIQLTGAEIDAIVDHIEVRFSGTIKLDRQEIVNAYGNVDHALQKAVGFAGVQIESMTLTK